MVLVNRAIMILVSCGLLGMLVGCTHTTNGKDGAMVYEVHRLYEAMTIDANWEKPAWQNVLPLELKRFMGDKPTHFPKVQAKLLYDDANLYVIFRVDDRYVRAVAQKHQDPVCRDSCVEFFFTPGVDVARGYFNLEMNSGGIMLLRFQTIPRSDSVALASADLKRVEIAHTLPKIVDPELTEPTTWFVEYRLPVDLLSTYCSTVVPPVPGVQWRANFFKCADKTSHPHWLTWSWVDRPQPEFHVPESFGTLVFK